MKSIFITFGFIFFDNLRSESGCIAPNPNKNLAKISEIFVWRTEFLFSENLRNLLFFTVIPILYCSRRRRYKLLKAIHNVVKVAMNVSSIVDMRFGQSSRFEVLFKPAEPFFSIVVIFFGSLGRVVYNKLLAFVLVNNITNTIFVFFT